MFKRFGNDLRLLRNSISELNKKVIIIFLSFAVLQTISWYVTSRRFYRENFFDSLQSDKLVYLYEYIYWYIGDFITYFIIPLLIIKFLFRGNISDYGIRTGDYKAGFFYTILFLAIMIPLVWFSSASAEYVNQYPGLQDVKHSWSIFFIFETCLFIYMIAWEFILRGYMLFGLKEKFGYYAILVQLIPFVILHNGKPMSETFGSIIAGLALGILAYRTGSIFYCIITHYGVMFTIDLLCTLRFRTQDYGTGITSLFNIFKGFLL